MDLWCKRRNTGSRWRMRSAPPQTRLLCCALRYRIESAGNALRSTRLNCRRAPATRADQSSKASTSGSRKGMRGSDCRGPTCASRSLAKSLWSAFNEPRGPEHDDVEGAAECIQIVRVLPPALELSSFQQARHRHLSCLTCPCDKSIIAVISPCSAGGRQAYPYQAGQSDQEFQGQSLTSSPLRSSAHCHHSEAREYWGNPSCSATTAAVFLPDHQMAAMSMANPAPHTTVAAIRPLIAASAATNTLCEP